MLEHQDGHMMNVHGGLMCGMEVSGCLSSIWNELYGWLLGSIELVPRGCPSLRAEHQGLQATGRPSLFPAGHGLAVSQTA